VANQLETIQLNQLETFPTVLPPGLQDRCLTRPSRCGVFPPGEEDRCLHMALPVTAFLEMLTKSVILRGTTAICDGCVQCGLGQNTPFSGHGSWNAAKDDPRPSIL